MGSGLSVRLLVIQITTLLRSRWDGNSNKESHERGKTNRSWSNKGGIRSWGNPVMFSLRESVRFSKISRETRGMEFFYSAIVRFERPAIVSTSLEAP